AAVAAPAAEESRVLVGPGEEPLPHRYLSDHRHRSPLPLISHVLKLKSYSVFSTVGQMTRTGSPAVEVFATEARRWLERHADARRDRRRGWAEGEFDVAVFHNLNEAEEADVLKRAVARHQEKAQ